MSSKPSNDPIYKQKRVLKGEIKYEVLAIITRLGKEGKSKKPKVLRND